MRGSPKRGKKRLQIRKKIDKILRFLQWKKHKRKFYKNIIIGIVLALFLHLFLLHTLWSELSVNQIFDSYFNRWETKRWIRAEINGGDFVFINIHTKRAGNEREKILLTPRDEVASAIQSAVSGGAKIVFPDIKFETTDYQHPERDTALRKVLAEIAQNNKTSVILPVGVEPDGKLKPNIFDNIITKSPNIYRALPGVVSSSDDDPVRRYWREYEFFYNQGNLEILWGVPLLVTVLREGNIQRLENCRKAILRGRPKLMRLHLNEKRTISVSTAKENQYLHRIRFTLMPPNVFKESNSNPDFEDVHRTPLGKMPGMYLMGNAIKTLLDDSQPTSAPLWMDICFELLIILISAGFFVFIPVLFAKAKILKNH